jgi:predicted nuclease of restriction endonuclease-like (RecB) superfamily
MQEVKIVNYKDAIQAIKSAILKSRYRAAALANREMLSLYYGIGKYISENSRTGFWGTGAVDTISEKLQQELPGLRGFSAVNIKRMRQFYEEWEFAFSNHLLSVNDLSLYINQDIPNRPLPADEIRQSATAELEKPDNHSIANRPLTADEIQLHLLTVNRALTTHEIHQPVIGELTEKTITFFMNIGFTHHCEILAKTRFFEERIFYIEHCATEFWSKETLRYHLKSNLFEKQGKILSNFQTTISDKDLQRKALLTFKDEYLLDFINIESPDDEPDERVLEHEIVNNIRKFIMSLGKDFSFIGNQHRMLVDEKEYFVDLLFFNRQLQSLVAFDLKKGDFKPEYLGKMNFYLSALDDLVRLPHENPSIGIILCKSQNQKTVEYAFRDMSKPMGVATYKTTSELPSEYQNVLPDAEKLKELL